MLLRAIHLTITKQSVSPRLFLFFSFCHSHSLLFTPCITRFAKCFVLCYTYPEVRVMEKIFSSRISVFIFIIIYGIRQICSSALWNKLGPLSVFDYPIYLILLIFFVCFLLKRERWLSVVVLIGFFLYSSLFLPSQYRDLKFKVISPQIESVALNLLKTHNAGESVELSGFNRILSCDNLAHIEDGRVLFLQSYGMPDGSDYYVYFTSEPNSSHYDITYLTDNIYHYTD